jgi:hypothetical protein
MHIDRWFFLAFLLMAANYRLVFNPIAQSRKKDREIYFLAREFLSGLDEPNLTEAVIESYLLAPAADRPKTINGIFQRLIRSAQNANMKVKVVSGSIGGIKNLGPVLFGFSPKRTISFYGQDSEKLLKAVIKQLKPTGKIRKESRSIWPQYCATTLAAADFLSRFKSALDFYAWVDFFDNDPRARPGLPLILAQEVKGIGFALACDFLKELGYANFGKPDVHVRDIFNAAGLCRADTSDYELFKILCRVADNAAVLPYTADKVFWLVGSGLFYNHRHLGSNGRIAGTKSAFIGML